MKASKEIFSTIVKVTYTKYSENIKVNAKNANQLRILINTDKDIVSHEVITQGDYIFNLKPQFKTVEVEIRNCNEISRYFTMSVEVREDDKIRILGDGFGDWVFKFQTVKTTGKGDYVKMYGNRVYFKWDAPTFN
jgi:hypothetical protein